MNRDGHVLAGLVLNCVIDKGTKGILMPSSVLRIVVTISKAFQRHLSHHDPDSKGIKVRSASHR